MWHSKVVQAAETAGALGEKHETNIFVDGRKGVKRIIVSANTEFLCGVIFVTSFL